MDTTSYVLMQQLQLSIQQNAELIAKMKESSVSTQAIQGDVVTIILAIIGLLGGVWAFLKIRAELSFQNKAKQIDADSKFNTQVLEKEAEENRNFQQSMVKSTQDSYISLVDRLMKFQENFMLDMKKDIVSMMTQVQRAGSISESVNKRLITFDKQFVARHEEIKAALNVVKEELKDIQNKHFTVETDENNT